LSIEETDTDEDEGEEPYLDGPERMRLLCGLASQWEEDESPRVECEVTSDVLLTLVRADLTQLGRLLLVPIPVPRGEPPTTMAQNLPATKGLQPKMFILVLNGTKGTAWTDLTTKVSEIALLPDSLLTIQAEVFKLAWKAGPGV
jgi:hypothetical protein